MGKAKKALLKKPNLWILKKKNMKPSLKFKDFLVTQICALKAKKALLKKPNLWILKKKKIMKPSLKFKDFLVTQICALKVKKALLKKPNLWILKKKNHEAKPKVQGFFSDANLRSESKESLAKKTK